MQPHLINQQPIEIVIPISIRLSYITPPIELFRITVRSAKNQEHAQAILRAVLPFRSTLDGCAQQLYNLERTLSQFFRMQPLLSPMIYNSNLVYFYSQYVIAAHMFKIAVDQVKLLVDAVPNPAEDLTLTISSDVDDESETVFVSTPGAITRCTTASVTPQHAPRSSRR